MATTLTALPPKIAPAGAVNGSRPGQALAVAALTLVAALGLHAYPVCRPWLFDDDFAILAASHTWTSTRSNLWMPWNDHPMPLGRITTWALVQVADRPTQLPFAAALQGPLAIMIALALLYRFVRKEFGHPFYGLVAMALFGVSLKYNEAVKWFAASFAILALNTLLLGLLAAQHWRSQRGSSSLLLVALAAALAPGWFGIGILAGPFMAIYLLPPFRLMASGVRQPNWRKYHLAAALVPIAGTLTFLVATLSLGGRQVTHADHYNGRTLAQVCNPAAGLELTGRTLVDNLVLGINAFGRTCPRSLVPLVLLAMALIASAWWRQPGARRRFLYLGAALVLASYWLVYSFRWPWPYEQLMARWTRYNLFPYLGLVMFVCGGLPARQGTLFVLDSRKHITRRQGQALAGLVCLMFLLQFPAGLMGHLHTDRDPAPQMAALRLVEAMDSRCQELGVSAEAARAALPTMVIPYSGDPTPRINGWDLLWGSAQPLDRTVAATRRLLNADGLTNAGTRRPDAP